MTPLENALLQSLEDCVALIEAWAYGQLFATAGVRWPGNECQAPALVRAKSLLIAHSEVRPIRYCEICGVRINIRA